MNVSFFTSCTVLTTGCTLTQDDMGITPVVDGYYSDYTNCFQVVSGVITAVSTCPSIYYVGQSALGGIIAYILEPGDPNYVAGEQHGLVATTSNISAGAEWGCWGTMLSGADGTAIGTGQQNTIDIMAGCPTAGIAARLCGDLVQGGYNDWFLPSKDELNKLYINKVAIGGFADSIYWASGEVFNTFTLGRTQNFADGFQGTAYKYLAYHVRAIRYF